LFKLAGEANFSILCIRLIDVRRRMMVAGLRGFAPSPGFARSVM
jgi:hypothetical protein